MRVDWITGFIERTGYFAVALLMLAENVFPPIPSELIMPLAGFTAARGDLNIVGAVLAGSGGSVLGSTLWYFAGCVYRAVTFRHESCRSD